MTDKWSLEIALLDILNVSQYSWQDLQKLLIQATLKRLHGNKTHAAKALGISVRTLRTKCGKFSI